STWPVVPTLQCGLFRSNFAFAMFFQSYDQLSRPVGHSNSIAASAASPGTRPWAEVFGAGDGNRTRVASLEGGSSTIELHPLASSRPRHLISADRRAASEHRRSASYVQSHQGL